MFTKEQLAKWRSEGFDFPEGFYDQVAVDGPKKIITIKYNSGKNEGTTVTLKFTITSSGLKDKRAIICVGHIKPDIPGIYNPKGKDEIKTNSLTMIAVTLTQDTITTSLSFPYSYLDIFDKNKLTLKGLVICDDLSAETSAFKLNNIPGDAKKKNECFCKKTYFTQDDFKYIVSELRKQEDRALMTQYDEKKNPLFVDSLGNVVSSNDRGRAPYEGAPKYQIQVSMYDQNAEDGKPIRDRLFYLKASDLNVRTSERDYVYFTNQVNNVFKNYNINTCLRKIHFLAQCYVETNRFRSTYEQTPSDSVRGGAYYRGRGLKQITHDYNYLAYYDYKKGKTFYNDYMKHRIGIYETVAQFNTRTENKYMSVDEIEKFKDFVKLVSTELFFSADAAGWYWKKYDINKWADKDSILNVSAMVNHPEALDTKDPVDLINSYNARLTTYLRLKEIFNYDECH